VAVFEALSAADLGDVPVIPGYFDESAKQIVDALAAIHRAGVIPIGLGGDHTIARPELRAVAAAHGPVGLIQIDAHSDTSSNYFGVPYTHGTPFYHAATEGLIDPGRTIQVGLRGSIYGADDYRVPEQLGFEVVTGVEAHELGMPALADRIRRRAGDGKVFLSFDVDFLDPAYAPGTGTPEIGGFTSWEAQVLLRALGGLHFVGFDVVEVIPEYDVAQNTALIAANVVFEFLSLVARSRIGGQ
jgi:agmatinase